MYYELGFHASTKLNRQAQNREIDIGLINLLAAIPELVKQENMVDALSNGLMTLSLVRERSRCAEILTNLNVSLGVDHLVYNNLTVHPLLKCRQEGEHGWGAPIHRYAEKLNEKHTQLLIDDMVENEVFHGLALAYARTENIAPAMRGLLAGSNLNLRRYAAFVLAYHGDTSGAEYLKDWANNTVYPKYPLEALLRFPDKDWLEFLTSFPKLEHPIHETGSWLKSLVHPLLRIRLTLKQISDPKERADFIFSEYGRHIDKVEVYNSCAGDKVTKTIEPAAFLLDHYNKAIPPSLIVAQNILRELGDHELQVILAERQKEEVKKLINRGGLSFNNLLDASLPKLYTVMHGMNWIRNLHPTGCLDKDQCYYCVPVKIHYDLDDYITSSTDWIINPLLHA